MMVSKGSLQACRRPAEALGQRYPLPLGRAKGQTSPGDLNRNPSITANRFPRPPGLVEHSQERHGIKQIFGAIFHF